MTYVILFVALAASCLAQNVSNLSAEIQRSPSASLYADRAAAYLAAGDAKGALADTDRALDKDALNVRALVLRAQANSKLNRFSAAVNDLSGAIALAPKDAALYAARSEAYTSIGDQPRAEADRAEALRLDPNILATLDRKPAATPAPAPVPPVQTAAVAPPPAREATVVTPPPPAPKAPPTKAPVATAPATAPAVVPPSADSADPYQRAKTLLNDSKNPEAVAAAISAMDEAIKAQPTNHIYFNTRGYARFLANDVKGALQDYDQALKLKPDYLNATQNRAVARRTAGDKAGADADKKRAAELSKK